MHTEDEAVGEYTFALWAYLEKGVTVEEGEMERKTGFVPVVSLLRRWYWIHRGRRERRGDTKGTENKVEIQNEEREYRRVHEFIEKLQEASE